MIPNHQVPNQQMNQDQNQIYYSQLGFNQMNIFPNNYNSQISPMIVFQTAPIPNNQNMMQQIQEHAMVSDQVNESDMTPIITQPKKKEKKRRSKKDASIEKTDPNQNDSTPKTINSPAVTEKKNSRSKNTKKKENLQPLQPLPTLSNPLLDDSTMKQTNFQLIDNNEYNINSTNNNNTGKNNRTSNPEEPPKQKTKSNHELKQIIGIVPTSVADKQYCFACKFSDSGQTEYIPNREMRKRYPTQLIKFYELHINAVYTQQPDLKV